MGEILGQIISIINGENSVESLEDRNNEMFGENIVVKLMWSFAVKKRLALIVPKCLGEVISQILSIWKKLSEPTRMKHLSGAPL